MERTLAQKGFGCFVNTGFGSTIMELWRCESLFQLLDKGRKRDTDSKAYLTKLQNVKTTLTRFVLAYEGLWLLKPFSEIVLTQVGVLPGLSQQRDQNFLLSTMNTLYRIERFGRFVTSLIKGQFKVVVVFERIPKLDIILKCDG